MRRCIESSSGFSVAHGLTGGVEVTQQVVLPAEGRETASDTSEEECL